MCNLLCGDCWYVKLQGASALTEIRIIEVTNKTILIEFMPRTSGYSTRYKISDIEFVEKIKQKA